MPIAYYPTFLRYDFPGTTDFNFSSFLVAHADDWSLAARVSMVLVGRVIKRRTKVEGTRRFEDSV